jgi:predicted phosphate transport protein (TIGR00153 family)
MFGPFISKDKEFYTMFQKAAENTSDAATCLYEFFMKFSSKSPGFQDEARKIKDLEHNGDQITHQTIEMLNRTFVTPIDREDIYLLITKMDDIIDLIDGSASRIQTYKINELTEEAIAFAQILKRAGDILKHSIHSMRNIRDYKEIIKHCVEIHTIENEGDQLLQQAMINLFEKEKHDPIKVIKWKEIYQNLESATDRCEDVANIIEGIVLKYA